MLSPSNPPKNNFRFALRAVRKARGLSQESFGLLSSRTYVSTLERGLKSPTLNKTDELAQVMKVHPLTLLLLAYVDLESESDTERLIQTVRSELTAIRDSNRKGGNVE